MPRLRPPDREEKLARRTALADKAAAGGLRLPQAVREMRRALGLTQARFAERFGLTRQQVIDLELGRANPTQETLQRIARPFGFTLGFVPRVRAGEEPGPD